ncbi:polysaccharide biosynthesis tyrosine autokinase [Candidatus Symbiobacter mobilis]|uniref:Putative tyrosine-protein kinase EpsB n=1 Tax=Candidatus Symbiobacter mobilis CR TaxID=946483 RepID=U5NDD8_9BURK|nr:polysaccharide biosynthesis tyrosine autokinase [Candidatus Symbiobacter mobilis]AGX88258.1 protein-tyrosine kinase [Candidatus Symbiobacter mobilis CR]
MDRTPLPTVSPASPVPAAVTWAAEDEDGIHLLDLLDVVLDHRWLIAAVTACCLVGGGLYAFLATPIYEANTLIQVEDGQGGGLGGLLGNAGNLFEIKSPATAEIEILRSRTVVGQAVQNLRLDVVIEPKYLPIVGEWLARHAQDLSEPGVFGMEGYVYGTEELVIADLRVAQPLEGQTLTVVALADGYRLQDERGRVLGEGKPNAPLSFMIDGHQGELVVARIHAKPGAEFLVSKRSALAVTESLQRSLNIAEKGKQSGIINTTLQGSDAWKTATILNEISNLYVRQNVQRKAAEAEKSIVFLNSQLPELRKQLEHSENRFSEFRRLRGTFNLSEEAKGLLDQSVSLRVRLLELRQRRTEMQARFTAQHPAMQVLDAQIQQIQSQLGALEGQSKNFPDVEQDMLRLTRDVKVNNELYTTLLNSFQQLRLIKEGKVGNVRIVDPAAIPEAPVKPRRALILALAGLLGALAGVGLAFVRNGLRAGIEHADEIEQHLGLRVFATVPHSHIQEELAAEHPSSRNLGHRLLASSHPNDICVESLRSLRTALQFAMLDATNKIVLVTGPTPGLGKSFVSANFALVLAAAGKRVLLVDADLRKGHVHESFGFDRSPGWSELIAGSQSLEDVLHVGAAPGLDFLSTGIIPPNPAELLMSAAAQGWLERFSKRYDAVVVDTPPVLAVADAQVLASQAGTVFLLARASITTLAELQESTKRLANVGTTVRGVIFNDIDLRKRRYGYGYGYGYKYGRYRYAQYDYSSATKRIPS